RRRPISDDHRCLSAKLQPYENRGVVMRIASSALVILSLLILSSLGITSAGAQYLGNYTINPTLPPAPPQMPGTFNNPYGNSSNSPQLFDSQGGYHGNVNSNQYDPNSIANPYGRYGSQYSPDSINNPY